MSKILSVKYYIGRKKLTELSVLSFLRRLFHHNNCFFILILLTQHPFIYLAKRHGPSCWSHHDEIFYKSSLVQAFSRKGKGNFACILKIFIFLNGVRETICKKVVVKPISGCVRTACSQLLWQVWNKLLSSCYKVDDGNRLATSCSNKTNTGCS
jgi:hypothetical protein